MDFAYLLKIMGLILYYMKLANWTHYHQRNNLPAFVTLPLINVISPYPKNTLA